MICSVHSTNNGAIVEDNTAAPESAACYAQGPGSPHPSLFCFVLLDAVSIACPAFSFLLIILLSQGFYEFSQASLWACYFTSDCSPVH